MFGTPARGKPGVFRAGVGMLAGERSGIGFEILARKRKEAGADNQKHPRK